MLFSLPLAVPPQAPQSVLIRYLFPVGRKLNFSFKQDMDLDIDAAGNSQPMNMETESEVSQTVKSVDADGTATLSAKVLKLKATVNGQDSPGADAAVGKETMITMDSLGAVKDMKAASGDQKPPFDISSLQTTGQMPKDAVQVGQSWDCSLKMAGLGEIPIKSTVTKIAPGDNGVNLVYFDSTAELDMAKMVSKFAPLPGLSGTGTGKIVMHTTFDVTDGLVLAMDGKVKYDMDMTNSNPMPGQPSSIHMVGNMTMSMSLLPSSIINPDKQQKR